MACSVTVLREKGRRLPRSEWPAVVTGRLTVHDWEGSANGFKRPVRVASVWTRQGTSTDRPVLTMFDPVFYRTVPGGFLLGGIELNSTEAGRVVYEHQQLWQVIPSGEG